MPFNFDEYEDECHLMSDAQLQSELQHYTRAATSGIVGMVSGSVLVIFTFGLSLVGSAVSYAASVNATHKIEILERILSMRSAIQRTRKRDVAAGLLIGTGTAALGLGVGHGVGEIIGQGVVSHSAGVYADRGADYAVDRQSSRR